MATGTHLQICGRSCPVCAELALETTFFCQTCGEPLAEAELVSLPTRGTIYSFTVVRSPTRRFAGRDAFVLAIVQLEGGPRLTGRLEGVSLDSVAVDDAVELARLDDGACVFRPLVQQNLAEPRRVPRRRPRREPVAA